MTGIFTSSLICSNLLGSRLVMIFGVSVSVGIFVFPFTFLVADLITELFGKSIALKVVRNGIALQIYSLIFVTIGLLLPTSPLSDTDAAYRTMFGLTPRMVFASICAYSLSQLLDVKIFAYLKNRTGGAHLLLRTNVTSMICQFLDTIVFLAIFLGGILPFEEWIKTFCFAYTSKLIVSFVSSPVVKLGVTILKPKMESKA